MKKSVLDASAILALINEEKGAGQVELHLPNAMISTVNLCEVATYLEKNGLPEIQAHQLLSDLFLEILSFDEEQAFIAARLNIKTKSKGLSLGDRACLALAITHRLPVITADKMWASLEVGVPIHVIR